jgi:hypothetical protein
MSPILELHLLAEALLASWRGAPAQHTAATELRFFPVHDGGSLAFRVPRDWHEAIELAGARSRLEFRPAARRGTLLRLELQPLSPRECAELPVERMRLAVGRAAAREAGDVVGIEPIAGRFGGGFLFSSAGRERITRGMFLVRPVLLEFTIETARAEHGLHAAALELVRSARASSA